MRIICLLNVATGLFIVYMMLTSDYVPSERWMVGSALANVFSVVLLTFSDKGTSKHE